MKCCHPTSCIKLSKVLLRIMLLTGSNNGWSRFTAKLMPTGSLRTLTNGRLNPSPLSDLNCNTHLHRIAIIAPFSGLRRFPQGRGLKQWTGDDSKALMKVYLPAIEGHVPIEMVHTVCDLIEFSYLVHRDVHDTQSLKAVDDALKSFHTNHKIFRTTGVVKSFNYPHQHSLKHYVALIHAYGAPNGLCSSMTENKHIKAVKKPWRRSSHYEALKQMLLTNQRLDKLSASLVHFKVNGMLEGDCLSHALARLRKYCYSLNYL